jgi:hypothetical protein
VQGFKVVLFFDDGGQLILQVEALGRQVFDHFFSAQSSVDLYCRTKI